MSANTNKPSKPNSPAQAKPQGPNQQTGKPTARPPAGKGNPTNTTGHKK